MRHHGITGVIIRVILLKKFKVNWNQLYCSDSRCFKWLKYQSELFKMVRMNVTFTFQLLALPSDILYKYRKMYSQRKMLEWNSISDASQAATKQKAVLTTSSANFHTDVWFPWILQGQPNRRQKATSIHISTVFHLYENVLHYPLSPVWNTTESTNRMLGLPLCKFLLQGDEDKLFPTFVTFSTDSKSNQ